MTVAKPTLSAAVKAKKKRQATPEGLPVHSLGTLLAERRSFARLSLRVGNSEATLDQITRPTPLHQRAFDLLSV